MMVGFAPAGPADMIARDGRRQAVRVLGPAGADRERDRRRRQRRRPTAPSRAAPDGYTLLMASNAQIVINPSLYREDVVQSGQGPGDDLAVGVHAQPARRAQRRAGEDRAGARRLCPRQSRQAHLRVGRHRHDAASRRRAVQVDGQGRHPARAVSRRDAGHHRPARRPRHACSSATSRRWCRWCAKASCARSPSPRPSGSARCPNCRP